MREKLENLISDALQNLGVKDPKVVLEHPTELSHGDYATNVAMRYGKDLGMTSLDLADKIKAHIKDHDSQYIERIEVAGAGFLNFYLSQLFFTDSIKEINKKGEDFGKSSAGNGKIVIVEYSSPNIAKPFTIGHLRSTIIGDAVANILAFSGFEVIRDNHIGDWGTQFGKLIVAIKKWGDEDEIASSLAPVKKLVELYVKFHEKAEKDKGLEDEAREWFAKLEQGDKEARRLWKRCIDWSLAEFQKIYDRLGVKFDSMLGESHFENKMKEVLEDVEKKGVGRVSEGAFLVFFKDDKYPPLMIRKSDGSTLYATRDLATDKYRLDQYGEGITIVNEVGAEQSLYFKQIFETEELLGYFNKDQRVHVAHGLYRFKEGKMSTRKGNVIWLDELLDEAVKRAGEFNPDTAEDVAIGAVKYNDLKRESIKDIVFDWDDVLNMKGNSGPYLQYSYARAQSVLEKAKKENKKAGYDVVPEKITSLEKMLYRFPEVVEYARVHYGPHHIATYIYELAQEFNNFYAHSTIVEDSPEAGYKVALTSAFAITLKNGLHLLGIKTPEKM